MASVGFPISCEAARCGIYIYSESTTVGLRSKEDLRRAFLQQYEESYKAGLARRRARAKSKETTSKNINASSFLAMVQNNVVKKAEPVEIGYDGGWSGLWVAPKVEPRVIKETPVGVEWVSHGVELFSIVVSRKIEEPAQKEEPAEWLGKGEESAEGDIDWDEPDEIDWGEPDEGTVEEPTKDSKEEPVEEWNEPEEDSIWDEPEVDEPRVVKPPVDDFAERRHSPRFQSREELSDRGSERYNGRRDRDFYDRHRGREMYPERERRGIERKPIPEPMERVQESPKSVAPVAQPPVRLDETAVREFVKKNKLCTESDILKAFPGNDSLKVKAVIKSALRKYKIFEKHGKFTV